jgi:hypothetical protein
LTGGARGEDFWKKRGGAVGPARPAGPKRGEGARGWAAMPAHGGGGAVGPPRGPRGKGRGAAGPKGEKGGEREKEKAFLFLISSFSYMPNSPLHSTTNKRVHNPA